MSSACRDGDTPELGAPLALGVGLGPVSLASSAPSVRWRFAGDDADIPGFEPARFCKRSFGNRASLINQFQGEIAVSDIISLTLSSPRHAEREVEEARPS
jgi:hypothetical protein